MSSKRATCTACLRPETSCICRWTSTIDSPVEVLILQHPLEVSHAKNSGRLLHMSLPNSRLLVGEAFNDALLETTLGGYRIPVLLYPDAPADAPSEAQTGIAAPPPFDPALTRDLDCLTLVVLDATWRKSRKMLYQNPLLQRLPRLPLRDTPPSHYQIRKAHAPDQMSTLEATAYALGQLENDMKRYGPLLDSFDGFVAQQQWHAATGRRAREIPAAGNSWMN